MTNLMLKKTELIIFKHKKKGTKIPNKNQAL